ncbi:MAG: hypothetical protein GYA14_03050, partial [Ignavibacteria bacterium]|nr:hypothetical protein [Ignavibacteria bacterium]
MKILADENIPQAKEAFSNFGDVRLIHCREITNQLLQDILLLNELNEAPQTIEKEMICINPLIDQVLQDVALK